jgi:hypothetical protein
MTDLKGFAVTELVLCTVGNEDAEDTVLNTMKKYEFKIHTTPKDTWKEANDDFQEFKIKNPTLVKVEVKNLQDLPKFLYL